jgi:hypothetical protein
MKISIDCSKTFGSGMPPNSCWITCRLRRSREMILSTWHPALLPCWMEPSMNCARVEHGHESRIRLGMNRGVRNLGIWFH